MKLKKTFLVMALSVLVAACQSSDQFVYPTEKETERTYTTDTWEGRCVLYFDHRYHKESLNACQKANSKNPDVQIILANFYLRGIADHSLKNPERALAIYEYLSQQGYGRATNGIGLYYQDKGDYAKARHYYELAARKGNPIAQSNLGYMFRDGQGVSKNQALANRYFEAAAAQNSASAQFALGWQHENGNGYRQSYVKAREYYELAAKKNHSMALNNLGVMYEKNRGGEHNLTKAMELYKKAYKFDSNNDTAYRNMKRLERQGYK
ncbi:tetratricopeptide repeat protein [Conservatibacter flavescens]|uniref:Sel1 repeat family protein n=1 Tax=Conservatibacter flavescens TaxID=28161 RepID=A0A2M8S1N9_9PAST|nr:tetratricopeptide repeat protein [Conservatibacter flavescens]PJG85045.1 hypothetical protein CVP05_07240 [Conservatibacter flavescens]